MTKTVAISLSDELRELELVLESAELIVELLLTSSLPDEESTRRAPAMLDSIISLALGRVRLLRRVVRKTAPVELIASRKNVVPTRPVPGEDPDIRLTTAVPRGAHRGR